MAKRHDPPPEPKPDPGDDDNKSWGGGRNEGQCPSCGGSGRDGRQDCRRCGGSGKA